MTPNQFFDQIVQAAPSFDTVRQEHLADNYDELLPHVLMADLLRYIETHYSGEPLYNAEPPSIEQVSGLLSVLDRGLVQGDDDTVNAIEVSFVEGLEDEPHFDRLAPLLGEAIRRELSRQKAWWQQRSRDA